MPAIPLLVLHHLPPAQREAIAARYDARFALTPAERESVIAAEGERFRAVLTIGSLGLTAAEMQAMPALEVVCCLGVGHELVDLEAARQRGIVVANGAGTNDSCVADHAFGLLIAAVRDLRGLDRMCRDGVWRTALPAHPPGLTGKRLGVLGLGGIGLKLARRALAFEMDVGYHNRRPRPDVDFPFFDTPRALAAWCDVLVCVLPGGPATRHLVDAAVLDALGPEGWLVNVGRGSAVDTEALAAALREGRIAGAGLDVYESEPEPPASLIGLDNLILSPHVAGWSPQSTGASLQRVFDNIDGHFARRGVVSPVA